MQKDMVKALNTKLSGDAMAKLTVRDIPDEVLRALRLRAAKHGRTTEAEVCEILTSAVKADAQLGFGDALAEMSREIALKNKDVEALEQTRDKTPAEPLRFEFIMRNY